MSMKKTFSIFLLLVVAQISLAQSAYISYRPFEQADRLASQLEGKRGVLILSKRNDLVITVTNATDIVASAAKRRSEDGLFEYEVVLDPTTPQQPKIEVNRRGDVDRVNWVTIPKPDYFMAYLIEETAKPIRLENQTAPNNAILNATLCEVEFQSTIPDLVVDCEELVKRGATVKREQKAADKSIQLIRVIIPVKILEQARQDMESLQRTHESLYERLTNKTDATPEEWEQYEIMKDQVSKAEDTYRSLTQLNVYAAGTNQLPVDISGLKPRSKMVYGVLLRTIIEEKHISQCAGFMAEGGRQFALRKYENARQSFLNAIKSPDTPKDMIASIRNTISQCDSCIKYEDLTFRALRRINELKQQGTVAQTDILDYYGAAADFMRIIEKYNPCDYYTKSIKTLETFIENMPLAMKFTITRWVVGRVSAQEEGPFTNVELWAYYGDSYPRLNDFSSDRLFRKLVSNNASDFKLQGISDANGIINIELNRKSLPKGFFFRPTNDNNKSSIVFKDASDIMSQSVGEYNKRQFRQKMYIKK